MVQKKVLNYPWALYIYIYIYIYWALVSVHLSVACLDLTRERESLESSKLAEWKPITLVTSEPILRSKGQGHQAD